MSRTEKKDRALVMSLCKDIARHASQMEAEAKNGEQSIARYSELKELLANHYLQGEDNLDTILKEIRSSTINAVDSSTVNPANAISLMKHALCMLDYFLMLSCEAEKE